MRKFLQFALNRVVITAVIVLIQVVFFLSEIFIWGSYYVEIAFILRFLSFCAVVYIVWRPNNPAVKLAWVVPILTFPLFGGVMYLFFGHVIVPKKLRDSVERTNVLVEKNLVQDETVRRALEEKDQAVAN